MLITSKPVVKENKKNIDLLVKHLLPPSEKPLWPQAKKPKPRGQLSKSISEKPIRDWCKSSKKPDLGDVAIKENASGNELAQAIVQTKRIRIHSAHIPKSKTDLGQILGKNHLRNRLVRFAFEFAKSVAKTSTIVEESKTYNETINDSVHRKK